MLKGLFSFLMDQKLQQAEKDAVKPAPQQSHLAILSSRRSLVSPMKADKKKRSNNEGKSERSAKDYEGDGSEKETNGRRPATVGSLRNIERQTSSRDLIFTNEGDDISQM